MPYSDKAHLATYMGVTEADLPEDADRLLERAAEIIDEAMLDNYDANNAAHVEAAKKANAAQVEYWLEDAGDDSSDITGPVQSVTIGSLQVQYGDDRNRITPTVLAPRAKRYLLTAGLLYRGVGMR